MNDDKNINIEKEERSDEELSNEKDIALNDEFKSKYTRLLAEFSNFQKQAKSEVESAIKFSNRNLLLKILDLLDDIGNGLAQEKMSEDLKPFLEILNVKILHILSLEGVSEVELEQGSEYDSSLCEVLSVQENPEMKNKIIQIVRKGYTYHDKVLRTAKVIVGK